MKIRTAAPTGALMPPCGIDVPTTLLLIASLITPTLASAKRPPARTTAAEAVTATAEAEAAPAKPLGAAPTTAPTAAPEAAPAATPAKPEAPFDPESRRLFLVRYGLQFSHESADFAQTKLGSVAMIDALSRRWIYALEFGGWADKGVGPTKNLSGSFFLTASVGVEVTGETVWARILVGPTLISHTDDRLSTNIQIQHEFSLGIRSKNGLGIGGFLKHFSNGGIKLPNESRDLFGFVVQFAM